MDTNHSTSNHIPLKACASGSNCVHPMGSWQPATREYYAIESRTKLGLRATCKACNNAKNAEYLSKNRDDVNRRHRENYAKNIDVSRAKARERGKAYRERHPDRVKESGKKYRKIHRERRIEESRKWRERFPEKQIAANKRWRTNNPDKQRNACRNWRYNNPEKHLEAASIRKHRRMANFRNLPANFTQQDWHISIEYFKNSCAVCETYFVSIRDARKDHWIPLNSDKCPGTIPQNIVPLCNHCNSSKADRVASMWLRTKYTEELATAIEKRVELFFAFLQRKMAS